MHTVLFPPEAASLGSTSDLSNLHHSILSDASAVRHANSHLHALAQRQCACGMRGEEGEREWCILSS